MFQTVEHTPITRSVKTRLVFNITRLSLFYVVFRIYDQSYVENKPIFVTRKHVSDKLHQINRKVQFTYVASDVGQFRNSRMTGLQTRNRKAGSFYRC